MSKKAPAPVITFPIYLYEEGVELPRTGKYYVVTKTGIYFHKETKAGDGLVPVEGIPWLQAPDLDMRLSLPKVPARIISQALAFFRLVFAKHKSEAYVTLMYSTKLAQYRLWCPKQKVSMASVNYDRTDQPDFADRKENDWQMVGTIHSHCDFSAYHSGVDHDDESTFDGIHITLGHVNRDNISMASSIAMNDKREEIDPESCCDGVARTTNKEQKESKWMTWERANFFSIQLSDEEAELLDQDIQVIREEWMPKVEKETWAWGGKWKKRDDEGLGFSGETWWD